MSLDMAKSLGVSGPKQDQHLINHFKRPVLQKSTQLTVKVKPEEMPMGEIVVTKIDCAC